MKKRFIMLSILLVICVLVSGCSSPSGNLIQPNAQAEPDQNLVEQNDKADIDQNIADEKKYMRNVVKLISSQLEIMTEEAGYFKLYSNDMDNKAYCAHFKIAYDDTKENYNRLVSLDVPPTLQSQHEMLLSYFKNIYKSSLAKYNLCMSERYSEQGIAYLAEAIEYVERAQENTEEILVWVEEWKKRYPDEIKMVSK